MYHINVENMFTIKHIINIIYHKSILTVLILLLNCHINYYGYKFDFDEYTFNNAQNRQNRQQGQ